MTYRTRQSGVTLIELMVGLVIGLVALLVIGQSMAVFEGAKRTTTGGSDAQTNGYAALLAMERDIRMVGGGMVGANGRLVCEQATFRQYNGSQETAASSPPNGFLPPIRIVSGGSGVGGDAIVMMRANVEYGSPLPSLLQVNWVGTSNCASEGALQEPTANDANRGQGDLFLIAPAGSRRGIGDLTTTPNADPACNLVQASAVTNVGACPPFVPVAQPIKYLTLATAATQPYNNGPAPVPTAQGGDLVVALGQSPYIRYGVENNKLMLAEQMKFVSNGNNYAASGDERQMDDIVYIAAQYGIDTDCASTVPGACGGVPASPASQSVDRFVAPTGVWANTALTPARFVRIKAIRLAVVARSPQYNPDLVSPASITVWQKINAADAAAPVFTGAGLDQHYRYRVFETVIPLKNMIWGQL
jgi:type IV pilus assembly protein PilW